MTGRSRSDPGARDDEAGRLRSALDELVELLTTVGVQAWPARLRRAQARIARGDRGGLQDVLDLLGAPGDGRLGDLVIHPLHGHSLADEDRDEANQQLGLLTTTCFRLARRLQRRP